LVRDSKKYIDNTYIYSLAEEIKRKFNPEKIILFGSYAYGTPGEDSDIDLLVIMDTDLSVKDQAFLIRRELDSSIPVDILVKTPGEIEERFKLGDFFIKKIIEKGIVL